MTTLQVIFALIKPNRAFAWTACSFAASMDAKPRLWRAGASRQILEILLRHVPNVDIGKDVTRENGTLEIRR
jgi:hypothetical protein